jgi:hypothetical protein
MHATCLANTALAMSSEAPSEVPSSLKRHFAGVFGTRVHDDEMTSAAVDQDVDADTIHAPGAPSSSHLEPVVAEWMHGAAIRGNIQLPSATTVAGGVLLRPPADIRMSSSIAAPRLASVERAITDTFERRRCHVCTPLDSVGCIEGVVRGAFLFGSCWCCRWHFRLRETGHPVPAVTVGNEFGSGALLYFRHVQMILGLNIALALLTLGQYAWLLWSQGHFENTTWRDIILGLSMAFLAPRDRPGWIGFSAALLIVSLIVTVMLPGLLRYYTRRWVGPHAIQDETHAGKDLLMSNQSLLWRHRFCRKSVSVFMFFLLLTIQGIIVWQVQLAIRKSDDRLSAWALASIVPISNYCWKGVLRWFTIFEGHVTSSEALAWDVWKILLLRVGNFLVLSAIEDLTLPEAAQMVRPQRVAVQLFWMLAMDIVVSLVFKIMYPLVWQCVGRLARVDTAAPESRAPFDVADETAIMMYRQMLVYTSMTLLPFAPLVGAGAAAATFWVDKLQIVWLSRIPKHKSRPISPRLLFWCHMACILAAVVAYPSGVVVTISQSTG